MLTVAAPWEYRWRFSILIVSQPVLALAVHWLSRSEGPWYAPTFSAMAGGLAVCLATIGILLRVHATASLHARVMASHNPDASRFVTSAIYQVIRNPLYVSSLLLFGGYAVFFGGYWAVGYVLFHWLRYQRVIRLEETCLREQWGIEFEDYCQKVPRWWPRWGQLRLPSLDISKHGLMSNIVYVALWAGIVVSAVMRDLSWVIPFELTGGAVMAVLYRGRSASVASPVESQGIVLPPAIRTDASPSPEPPTLLKQTSVTAAPKS